MEFYKLLLTLCLLSTASSDIALAGAFGPVPLPNVESHSFTNHVVWRNLTMDYRFTAIGFTEAQTDKIKRSMDLMFDVLRDPTNGNNTGPMNAFQKCIVDHATRYQAPNWLAGNLDERRYAVGIVTAMMVASAGKLNFINGFTETKPSAGRDFIRAGYASVDTTKAGLNTNIHLNTFAVDKRPVANIAGLIMHEMMHNEGWDHPSTGKGNQDYPGTFIKESEICLRDHINAGVAPAVLINDGLNIEAE